MEPRLITPAALPPEPSADGIAPRPVSLAQSGLSPDYVADLFCKQLLQSGALTMSALIKRLALAGPILEATVTYLKREGRIEVRAQTVGASTGDLRYGLTERGRSYALDAQTRDAYVGPAPVSLEDYRRVVQVQSAHRRPVQAHQLQRAFGDAVVSPDLVRRLGPALNSGRAIFIFGTAGAGKTFLARRLVAALGDSILVPYAVLVGDSTVQVFDPLVHVSRENPAAEAGLRMEEGGDPRYVRCGRPLVVAGGELTLSMLDVHSDVRNGRQIAPLQWRANNGLLLIDDLGRQRVPVDAILNRWIVPMEEGCDHLMTMAGQHFTVPFELSLVFSSNLDPSALLDDAFLRRIGYKIEFGAIDRDAYLEIFHREMRRRDLVTGNGAEDYLIDGLHRCNGVPLLPCHPRDLLGMIKDYCNFTGTPGVIDAKLLQWAWSNYFVTPAVSPQDSSTWMKN